MKLPHFIKTIDRNLAPFNILKILSTKKRFNFQNGFNLVELLVAISIMGILFGMGYSNFRGFSSRQALLNTSKMVESDIRLAQSSALAGQLPSDLGCNGANDLNGYFFTILNNTSYEIRASCSGGIPSAKKTVNLPSGIIFTSTPSSILFKVLGNGTDLLSSKSISLSQSGTNNASNISVSIGGQVDLVALAPGSTSAPVPTSTPAQTNIVLNSVISGTTSSGTSLTLVKPSTMVSGNVIIAQVVVSAATVVITPPSGWTLIRRDQTSSAIALASYYKVAGASEPSSYVWNFGSSVNAGGGVADFDRVNTTNPINASSGQYIAGPSMTAPSISTTVANTMLIYMGAVNVSASLTAPSGMTTQWNTTFSNNTAFMSTQSNSLAGNTGTRTVTVPTTNGTAAQLIALTPGP